MITKKRLEELIKQGATIYGKIYGDILAIELSKKNKPEIKYDDRLDVYCTSNEWRNKMQFCYLWETEEDARWELEMTATRTETLRMPPFIEVCDGCIYDITFIDNKKCKWQLTISDNGIALLDFALLGRDKFWNKLTKENYTEACKLCLKLFKGEEV